MFAFGAKSLFSCASRTQNACQLLPKLRVHSQVLSTNLEDTIKKSYENKPIQDSWSNLSEKVNTQLKEKTAGRLFAVVALSGHQRKITQDDVIMIENSIMSAHNGDKIVLNKVLLVGGSDFTLIGRPILRPDVVRVEATVIEKTQSNPKISFWYRKRENWRFFKLKKDTLTYLRITDIKLLGVPNDEGQKS